MKNVRAYEALDGSLHKSKAGAAEASILHLGKTLNKDQRGQSIGPCEVAFIIEHRKKIAPLLQEIDLPEIEPDYGCNH